MAGRKKSKENQETAKERLLLAAVKLFALKGYEGTTTRQIAAEAGSSISMLNLYYGTKEKLYEAAMEHIMDVCIRQNIYIFKDIIDSRQMESDNIQRIWEMIEKLTDLLLRIIRSTEYQYEVLLLNRELQDRQQSFRQIEPILMFFYNYELLFEAYTKSPPNTDWARELSFVTITGMLSEISYPKLYEHFVSTDKYMDERVHFTKEYHLSAIHETLMAHKNI